MTSLGPRDEAGVCPNNWGRNSDAFLLDEIHETDDRAVGHPPVGGDDRLEVGVDEYLLSPHGSEERSLLESISNHVQARGAAQAVQGDRQIPMAFKGKTP